MPVGDWQFWVVSLADPEPHRLTSGPFDETLLAWDPRGDRLFFVSDRRKEPWFGQVDTDLYSVRLGQNRSVREVDMPGRITAGSLSRDGTWALTGRVNPPQARSYVQNDLFAVDPGAG